MVPPAVATNRSRTRWWRPLPPRRCPSLSPLLRNSADRRSGQTKPVFHKKAKTTKKIVLRLECNVCKQKSQLPIKRCKHFELGLVGHEETVDDANARTAATRRPRAQLSCSRGRVAGEHCCDSSWASGIHFQCMYGSVVAAAKRQRRNRSVCLGLAMLSVQVSSTLSCCSLPPINARACTG
jgi:hypothetical protein